MNQEYQKLIKDLETLYKALDIAKEGLEVLKDKEPIAKKTLNEIDKIYNKILGS